MTGNITLRGEMLYNVECPSFKIMNKIRSHNHHWCSAVLSRSVVSDSLRPRGLQPARLLWPWGLSRQGCGVDCHAFLQGIFPTQGLSPGLPHCRRILYCLSHRESESETASQSCLTLCDPMDCSLPGSSVHGIFQASPPKNTIAQKIPVNLLFYVC